MVANPRFAGSSRESAANVERRLRALERRQAAGGSSATAGIPSGGSADQVLTKDSAVDYDASWQTPEPGIPVGGSAGQVLTKDTGTDYDASWQDVTVTPSDTGWVTLPSNVGDWGIQYRCIDSVVTIIIDGGYTSTAGTSDIISTSNLPSQYCPPNIARTGAYFSGHPGTVSITAGGTVTALQQSGAGRSSVSATVTYLVPNTPTGSVYADTVLADSPYFYWRLGDTSGTVASDSSGNGRTGTYTNGPTLSSASLLASDSTNKAVTFDGTNDYIASSVNNDPTSFTAECWFKSSTPTTGGAYLMHRWSTNSSFRAWYLAISGSGFPTFGVKNAANADDFTSSSAANLNNGAAHHVVGTYDGTTMRLYVDGTQVSSKAFAGPVKTTGIQLQAGAQDGTSSQLNGVIDEVAYYTTVLSAGRIAAHYAAGI